jgi:hypothetical protein
MVNRLLRLALRATIVPVKVCLSNILADVIEKALVEKILLIECQLRLLHVCFHHDYTVEQGSLIPCLLHLLEVSFANFGRKPIMVALLDNSHWLCELIFADKLIAFVD